MKIINQSVSLITETTAMLQTIEVCGRTAYQSYVTHCVDEEKFIAHIIKLGHESVLEHGSMTYRIICDRGVSHELVRHRLASYTQESTRYCNYSLDKFGQELTFINPLMDPLSHQFSIWVNTMKCIEVAYLALIDMGCSAQEARSVLPNSLKTTVCMTANMREWRHFLRLRTSPKAHPMMRDVALQIHASIKSIYPVLVADIET